jgi:hypothetical protein
MSSPSILVGIPVLTINPVDGSLSCSFVANFVTLPPSVGGIGYNLVTFLKCRSGTIQTNCINNTTNQSISTTRQFGVLQGQSQSWTSSEPPDGTQLLGNVTLSPPICDLGSTAQVSIAAYVTVELCLEQNRIHNAVRQQIEHFPWQTV